MTLTRSNLNKDKEKPKPANNKSPQKPAVTPGSKNGSKGKQIQNKQDAERTPTKPLDSKQDNKDSTSRFVCSVCKNSEKIRTNRLILETELLSEQVDKINQIKSSLTDHASQIEMLDLHVQHLLLNRDDFVQYQTRIASIEKQCNQFMCDIATLGENTSNAPPTTPYPLSDFDPTNFCDKLTESLNHRLDSIEKTIENISNSSQPPPTNTPFEQYRLLPPNMVLSEIPCDNIEQYKPNFIDSELSNDLLKFLEQENNFTEKNGHSVIALGKPYKYNGSHTDEFQTTTIPAPIQKVISKIESEFPGSNANINQCLINQYKGPKSYMPEHADDEPIISPESTIFTVSIGASRNVKFVNNSLDKTETLLVEDRSPYCMSRKSQHFWTHRIDKDSDLLETSTRYSLTFRCVGEEFKKSTIILGDSNTRHLKFGTEKKTFGEELPGKRVQTFKIEDLSPSACIGYQNVIIHVGVNNLKSTRMPVVLGDTQHINVWDHFKLYEAKINTIRSLCPRANLYLSPALPSKLRWLNHRILEFDSYLRDYISANIGLKSFDFNDFADDENILRSEYGCYKNKYDNIHIGSWGIFQFACKIKRAILGSHTDTRDYASVVKSDDGKSHFNDILPS